MENKEKRACISLSHRLYRYLILALLGGIGVLGCTELFEEPVTDAVPELLSPGDSAHTGRYAIEFLWEPVEYALEYRVQVVTPSFDSVNLYVADTIVSDRRYLQTLDPGRYQWRVRAQNGSSSSVYSTRTFTVHRSDLSGQRVLQEAPGRDILTNDPDISFSWQSIFGVDVYELQIDTDNFSNPDRLVARETTVATTHGFTLPAEGRYEWRVSGSNDTAQTQWSDVRVITLDQTPPAAPTPVSPNNNQQVARPVTLRWRRDSDADHYLVYVYQADSTILDAAQFPQSVRDTTFVSSGGASRASLLWRVRSVDKAGNTSAYSDWRRYTLTN